MGVRQLEEFLGQADQKGFWIFSYANLGGAFFGAFIGNSLFERLAPSLKLLGILLGVLLGVLITWKVKGYPIYKWAFSYVMFLLRRYLKVGLGDSIIDAGLYYRARTVKQEPFMLVANRDGRPVPVLVHRGSGAMSSADLFDGLFAPSLLPAEDRLWGSIASARSPHGSATAADTVVRADTVSNNGHSPRPAPSGEQPHVDYSDWDL
jgi:hypothetical protein